MNHKVFKIKKIKIKNDHVLGNLELDFSLPKDEVIADIIVFSGDNGTGKTRLLKYLTFDYDFMIHQSVNITYEMYDYEINDREKNDFEKYGLFMNLTMHVLKYEFVFNGPSTKINKIFTGYRSDDITKTTIKEEQTIEYFKDYGEMFTSFDFFKKEYVNDNILKVIKNIYDESEKETIKYLNSLEEYKNVNNKNIFLKWKNFVLLFNNIFKINNLQIKGFDIGAQKISFKKYDKEYLIDNASAGEKQIINLLTLLIKNNDSSKIIIGIDEIELYLHPRWQINLLNEIRKIKNNQQIFISTHSPFVQIAIDNEKDLIYTATRDDQGKIKYFQNNKYAIEETSNLIQLFHLDKGITNIVVSGPLDNFYLEQVIRLWPDEFKKPMFIQSPYKKSKNSSAGDSEQLLLHLSWLEVLEQNKDWKIFFLYDHDFNYEQKFDISKRKPRDEKLINLFYQTSWQWKLDNEIKQFEMLKDYKINGIENFLSLDEKFIDKLKDKIQNISNQNKKEDIKKLIKNDIKNLFLNKTDEKQKKILKYVKEHFLKNVSKLK